jgi:hypothetical protein
VAPAVVAEPVVEGLIPMRIEVSMADKAEPVAEAVAEAFSSTVGLLQPEALMV